MEHSDIGEKIKQLRIDRKMTQSALAGDQITRNMLSRIENGAALPSLPTVWYLAERLGVPAGFLLAEGKDDRIWRKMNRIESIRRVLRRGDARICMELCKEDAGAQEADDEIALIMAECSLRLAVEAFDRGRLHEACASLDAALEYADATVYDTSSTVSAAYLYFRFMRRLSAMLYSEILQDIDDPMVGGRDAFGRYVLALEALEAGEEKRVEYYRAQAEKDSWCTHFCAHCDVSVGKYEQAYDALLQLLRSEEEHSRPLLYFVFQDLEICCREMGDFKGAYEYSRNKVTLLEQMLQR